MSSKNKISSWWKGQSAAIKAAMIAGIFGFLVAFCGCAGSIATVLVNYYLSNLPFTLLASINYPFHLNGAYDSAPTLFATISGVDYTGVVPTKCVQADYGNGSRTEFFNESSVLSDAQRRSFAFDLVTNTPLIITDAEIISQNYASPPSQEYIKNITFSDPWAVVEPPLMGPVTPIIFSETKIDPTTTKLTITRVGGSLRLDPGDAVTFIIPLVFSDPGLYRIQFIVQGQLSLEREINFTSDTYSDGWMYVDNITSFPIKTSSKLLK